MSYTATLGGGGWTVGDIDKEEAGPTVFPTSAAGYPAGAVPVASQHSVAAATATATLAAAVGKRTYVTSLQVTGGGATAGSLNGATLAGALGGTINYTIAIPAGANLGITPILITFNPPLPAAADNTALVLSTPSWGAGNAIANVALQGFQL